MSVETARAKMNAAIWQGVAQSGVDLSALPSEQQTALVNAIADSVLVAVDDLIGELEPAEPAEAGAEAEGEQLLWSGRPFLSVSSSYQITSERVIVRQGLFNLKQENYDLYRIRDVDYSQSAGERMVNIGDITLHGADPSDPVLVLRNIHSPERVHNILREAVAAARERHRVLTRDVM